MEHLPLLTRPAKPKDSGLPKWPFVLAGLIFFGVLAAGNFFIDRSIPSEGDIVIRKTTEPLQVSLDVSKDAAPYPAGWSAFFDPTLMVLPNEQSYSKAYLLKSPAAPPATFDLSIQSKPYEFQRPYFRTSGAISPTRAGSWSKQDPALIVVTKETPLPEAAPMSLIGIYGELHSRTILSLPDFPKVTHSELLTPTEISIGVDSSGGVRMALLEKSCGDDRIDELGLKLAREASFAPVSPANDRLTWGWLRIAWAVDVKTQKP
jgi:hypothetical protein